MRLLFGFLLTGHGVTHLVGFLAAWQLRSFPDAPFQTTILSGAVDLGRTGMRIVGVVWLLAALGFVALGVACLLRAPWWQSWVWPMLAGSGILCLIQLPGTRFGLLVNVGLSAFLLAGLRLGWFVAGTL